MVLNPINVGSTGGRSSFGMSRNPGTSALKSWNRITSYNVCYTKLLRVLIYPVLLTIELQQVAILATREPSQGHLFTLGRDGLKIAAQKVLQKCVDVTRKIAKGNLNVALDIDCSKEIAYV